MDAATRIQVRQRAGDRCEFCHLPQAYVLVTFHVEHIIPKQHGGSDDADNLGYACNRCNWHKGPNLTGIDPESGQIATLFNPRRQAWEDHFSWHGAAIVGLTPTGRATLQVLQMNASLRLRLRSRLHARGLLP